MEANVSEMLLYKMTKIFSIARFSQHYCYKSKRGADGVLQKEVEREYTNNQRGRTHAPELTLMEGTSLLHQPMACREG